MKVSIKTEEKADARQNHRGRHGVKMEGRTGNSVTPRDRSRSRQRNFSRDRSHDSTGTLVKAMQDSSISNTVLSVTKVLPI